MAMAELRSCVQSESQVFLIERSTCRDYFKLRGGTAPGGPKEEDCKVGTIQATVAYIEGWTRVVHLSVGLFCGVAYPFAVEKVGVKRVLVVNAISHAAQMAFIVVIFFLPNLNPRLVWLSPLFDLAGGGEDIFAALHYTVLSDRTLATEDLAPSYYRLGLTILLAKFFGASLTSIMLGKHLLLLYAVTLGLAALVIVVVAALPEFEASSTDALVINCTEDSYITFPSQAEESSSQTSQTRVLDRALREDQLLANIQQVVLSILGHRGLSIGLIAVVFASFGHSCEKLLHQWPSATMGWSLSQVSLLSAYASVVNSATLALLPHVRNIVREGDTSSFAADWRVIVASLVLSIIGIAGAGLASSSLLLIMAVTLLGLGVGLLYTLRAVLVEASDLVNVSAARINILFTVFVAVGSLAGTPVYLALSTVALGQGWIPTSSPFLVSAASYALCGAAVTFLKHSFAQ